MSFSPMVLVLKCSAPLQSWGTSSQFNVRDTGSMPTKSGIAGICCAALGFSRGSDNESKFLEQFNTLYFKTIRFPRPYYRLRDYQTVHNTRQASGKIKESHQTWRYYITDASFAVLIQGEQSFLESIEAALKNPIWGIWFGRKSCIPSEPICWGLVKSENEAFERLKLSPSTKMITQADVESFKEGTDSLRDIAISFDSDKRNHSFRRTKRHGEFNETH